MSEAIQPSISTFSVTKHGRVAETYALLAGWDLAADLNENLQRFRAQNPILAGTEKWLKEMSKIFHVRFGDIGRHRPLIRLAQAGMPQSEWAPLLLWHLTYRELLLSDFLETWLFPRRQEGLLRVRSDDVRRYLETLPQRGLVDREWSENTISKMASALPRYAADFGLLTGRVVKEITPYQLPDTALLYLLHAMAEEASQPPRVITDPRWRRFLLTTAELERELMRLHQLQRLRYDVAGSVVSLELPFPTVEAYVDDLVGH